MRPTRCRLRHARYGIDSTGGARSIYASLRDRVGRRHQTWMWPLLFWPIWFAKAEASNDWPIIGIYTAPSDSGGDKLAASYVKWIEAAGGRVVPIPYHISQEHAKGNLSVLNGLLFPGGDAELPDNARAMFDYALQLNDQGHYFPVWGTCLGFEWLLKMQGGVLDDDYDAHNISLPLHFTPEAAKSRLFARAPDSLLKIYAGQNVSMNNHAQGITPAKFQSNRALADFFKVLSYNQDRKHKLFVSTIEARKYPIYGTQWHPEKNQFEWGKNAQGIPNEVINHSSDAIKAGAFPAAFFVEEARKSQHKFPSAAAEAAALIWNWPVTYTGNSSPDFVQEYLNLFPTGEGEGASGRRRDWTPTRA
eukprot:g17095.t1